MEYFLWTGRMIFFIHFMTGKRINIFENRKIILFLRQIVEYC